MANMDFFAATAAGAKMGKVAANIDPVILAADFARLGQQAAEREGAGADRLHIRISTTPDSLLVYPEGNDN
jgi:hypothetical protein